jgi:hypothetical protein
MAKQFNFQLQFSVETGTERETLVSHMSNIIETSGSIVRFWTDKTEDNSYINFNAVVENPNEFWTDVKPRLGGFPPAGIAPRLIATCEGDHGWDDYLLLLHFDRRLKLDALAQGGAK